MRPVCQPLARRPVVLVCGLIVCGLVACGAGSADRRGAASSDAKNREVVLGADGTKPAQPARARETTRPARMAKPRGAPKSSAPVAARPQIESWPIPFPEARRRETAEYTRRHYGTGAVELDPKLIVEHYTVTPTAQEVHELFARDKPDVELRELPGVCSHFLIDRDGTIYQLVSLRLICRHTVGLNDVSIGIEHVGGSDSEVLDNKAQFDSSLALTAWLRCRFGIATKDVIGHAESLSSRYHHERVPSLRTQTHEDFQPASMNRYRDELATRRC